ncbi:unnamed protein product [Gongylonema pulchrum]|uniref:Uncharacterized protein n=1 Tax=Gongylonema pulchrum TaxID=637853 RepID=A0A183CY31_9BILA|nr:unnamed protein product [Gongylonema pulchrum]
MNRGFPCGTPLMRTNMEKQQQIKLFPMGMRYDGILTAYRSKIQDERQVCRFKLDGGLVSDQTVVLPFKMELRFCRPKLSGDFAALNERRLSLQIEWKCGQLKFKNGSVFQTKRLDSGSVVQTVRWFCDGFADLNETVAASFSIELRLIQIEHWFCRSI